MNQIHGLPFFSHIEVDEMIPTSDGIPLYESKKTRGYRTLEKIDRLLYIDQKSYELYNILKQEGNITLSHEFEGKWISSQYDTHPILEDRNRWQISHYDSEIKPWQTALKVALWVVSFLFGILPGIVLLYLKFKYRTETQALFDNSSKRIHPRERFETQHFREKYPRLTAIQYLNDAEKKRYIDSEATTKASIPFYFETLKGEKLHILTINPDYREEWITIINLAQSGFQNISLTSIQSPFSGDENVLSDHQRKVEDFRTSIQEQFGENEKFTFDIQYIHTQLIPYLKTNPSKPHAIFIHFKKERQQQTLLDLLEKHGYLDFTYLSTSAESNWNRRLQTHTFYRQLIKPRRITFKSSS